MNTKDILKLSINDYDILFDNADLLGDFDNERLISIINHKKFENIDKIENAENIKSYEIFMLHALKKGMCIIWIED